MSESLSQPPAVRNFVVFLETVHLEEYWSLRIDGKGNLTPQGVEDVDVAPESLMEHQLFSLAGISAEEAEALADDVRNAVQEKRREYYHTPPPLITGEYATKEDLDRYIASFMDGQLTPVQAESLEKKLRHFAFEMKLEQGHDTPDLFSGSTLDVLESVYKIIRPEN